MLVCIALTHSQTWAALYPLQVSYGSSGHTGSFGSAMCVWHASCVSGTCFPQLDMTLSYAFVTIYPFILFSQGFLDIFHSTLSAPA